MRDTPVKRVVHGIELLEVKGDEGGATILLLHGYGADFEDLLSFSKLEFPHKKRPTFFFPRGPLEIPIAPGYSGRGWFPINWEMLEEKEHIERAFPKEFSSIRTQMQSLIAALTPSLSTLLIGGFSQGAILALDTALNAPQKLKGLILFSGMLVREEEWRRLKNNIHALPFFQSHGTEDSILPFNCAQALERFLIDAGAQGKLDAFLGRHDIPHSIILKFHEFLKKVL